MIIAYHGIFSTYGTWLPNDPRGSYSKEVYRRELLALGRIKYGRQDPQPDADVLRAFWTAAQPMLSRPPYFIEDSTRPVVANAFGRVVRRLRLTLRACSIMNDHVHALWEATKHRAEYVVNQLKGAATHDLRLAQTPWTRKCWKVFINDADALRAAAEYIEDNPRKSGLAQQSWEFVTALPAL